jgi:Flp pilus assembly protein CpaB
MSAYQEEKHRARFVVGVGIILAMFAGVAGYMLLSRAQQQVTFTDVDRVAAVVAVRTLTARVPIAAEDVEVRQVPADETNLNGVATDVSQVVGRLPAVTILEGQLVATNMLASVSEGGRFSILLPEETISPDSEAWRAVSVTVPDDLAVGGLLETGQTVDLFVTAVVSVPTDLIEEGEYYTDRSTKIVYQDVVILAREGTFYVIRASLPVAEEIVHLQAAGGTTFSLALRPSVDRRLSDARALGTTTNRIIEKYGLPIPEALDGGVVTGGPGVPAPTPTPTPLPEPSEPVPSPSQTP